MSVSAMARAQEQAWKTLVQDPLSATVSRPDNLDHSRPAAPQGAGNGGSEGGREAPSQRQCDRRPMARGGLR